MKQKLSPFVPMYVATMESPAWLAMSPGARLLYLALKKRYRRSKEEAVYLSVRTAAKELRVNKDTVAPWYHELEHFGFIFQVQAAYFGSGKGKAALYRLTDEPYKGKRATKEFSYWNGTPFTSESKQFRPKNPDENQFFVRKTRTVSSENSGRKPRNCQIFRPKNPDISRSF
jgi:DNA-binding transcriptional MocR family regulator